MKLDKTRIRGVVCEPRMYARLKSNNSFPFNKETRKNRAFMRALALFGRGSSNSQPLPAEFSPFQCFQLFGLCFAFFVLTRNLGRQINPDNFSRNLTC